MKIWITAYALTKGILECESQDETVSLKDHNVVVKWKGGMNEVAMFHGNDWHLSKEQAINRVRDMIDAKRKSLEKALINLDRLEEKWT